MNKKTLVKLSIAVALCLPIGAIAKDYRASNPATWTAHTVDNAIKGLYGEVTFIQSDKVILKLAKVVASGSAVPIKIKSTIDAKSVSVFQDTNPESAVAVWSVPKGGIVDYGVKIKLKSDATLKVVIEGRDGNFYTATSFVQVSGGGCEGG